MLIQIPGTPLVRDTKSMAIINRDQQGLEEYQRKRNFLASQKQEINNMKSDIDGLREDMKEIKTLMLQLLGKGSNG